MNHMERLAEGRIVASYTVVSPTLGYHAFFKTGLDFDRMPHRSLVNYVCDFDKSKPY
jgi:hypothetical protein